MTFAGPRVLHIKFRRGSAAGSDVTDPEYSAGEIGDVDQDVIEITFSEQVQATDFADGVTIEVNAVGQTINSAVLQSGNLVVHYTIAADADINDVITWEYSEAAGNIEDLASNALGDVTPQTCTNYIGSHFYHDTQESSAHLVHL